ASPSATASPASDQVAAQQQAQSLLTLAVDQEQAQKLIHGEQTGALYFALLNAHSSVTPGPGVDNRHLFGDGG
ncbi:MAG: Flp pilus assembly protein RcpC/CpaB, partial [Frankiales bacterium]|nr:Flp pilus assembly protein RcpC/CpaB [Frankiales bacterium]